MIMESSANDSKLGKLTEESFKRKECLRKLRAQVQQCEKKKGEKESEDQVLPRPVFRSYRPQNENTDGEILPQEPTGDIELAVESQLEMLSEPLNIEEIDIANLAPRKPDWDLKRDVAKKLDILERRTQKAIAELIRERLKKNQDGSQDQNYNILQAVNVGAALAGEKGNKNVDDGE